MRSQYHPPQKQPVPGALPGINTSSKGKQLPAALPLQKQAGKGISEPEFSAEEKPQPGKFILPTAVINTPPPLQAKFVIPDTASRQPHKTGQPGAWHAVQKRAVTVTRLVTNQSAVIQYKKIKIIDSNASSNWGNEKEISVSRLSTIVKKAGNFHDGRINLGEEDEYWITIGNVINGVEMAIAETEEEMEEEDGEQPNTELNKLRSILAALNNEGPLDTPDVTLPPKPITPGIKKPAIKPTPVKKLPVKPVTNKEPVIKTAPKRKLDDGPGDLSSDTSSHSDEEILSRSGKKQEKGTDQGKKKGRRQQKKQKTAPKKPFKPIPLPGFGPEQDNDTRYAHDRNNRRLFLTDAPPKVLGLMGESGKLIKGKDFNGTGPDGEKADLRYIDFVNVIDNILTRLAKNPADKALLQRTIKILHEFLVFIHDFKYRVRYELLKLEVEEDVLSSRLKEIEKCKIEVEVLNGMVADIVAAPSLLKIPPLIQRARDFFNITFGFGVTGSIHPGDMFGGPIDVNHVNFQSSFTEQHYKRSFKRTEDIRKETNKGHEGSTFEEDYFTKGLFTMAEHAVTEFGGNPKDEEDIQNFIKSKGISRESVKLLRKKPDKEEDEEGSFSDFLDDSESEGEDARSKFVPNESDTISEFAQKLEPYLITSADFAKQFNETILLRQHQLSKRPKQRDTRLLTIAKQQRAKEKADLEFIASGHKKEIADKLLRQLEEINAMLSASETVKRKKTATRTTGTGQKKKTIELENAADILKAWGRNDFVKQSAALQALKEKPKIDDIIAALRELKTAFESVDFDTFYEEHTKSGQEYVYDSTQKFNFLGDPKKRSVKKKAERHKKKTVSKAPSGSSKKEPPKPPQTPQQLKKSALLKDFIAELEKVPQQEDEDEEGASKADHTHHASKFINTGREELSMEAQAKSTWFNRIPNEGGGDCLLYALKGKNLSFEEGLLLRAQIAEGAGVTAPPNISGNSVYQTLYQSRLLTKQIQDLLQGKHQVPREVYQKLIKIPGVYTGEEEIQAYCALEDSPKVVHVVTHEGEIREITADSITMMVKLSETNPMAFLKLIAGYLQKKELVLFKSANHWEKILGLNK